MPQSFPAVCTAYGVCWRVRSALAFVTLLVVGVRVDLWAYVYTHGNTCHVFGTQLFDQAKKLLDDRAFRGKANLVVRTKYWQNAAFEMDLEVKILALEGLQMQGKRARQPKLLLRVEVSPGHEATTEELVYSDKEGVWEMSGMTHFFGDVQLTDNVDITLVVRAGKKGGRTREGYLGHIESSIGLIDRRICTEVGLDADCLTSFYPVCFDQPQQVFLFTGSGLRDGHIRMFNTMPRNDSSVPIKIFKGHTQTVTGMSLCDAYGKRCLISCSWDGSCKLWSVQAEDKPIALETFVVGDGNLHNNTVTMTYIRMYLWVVVGSSDRSVRLIKVSKDAAVPKSFRRDLATWLDSPPVRLSLSRLPVVCEHVLSRLMACTQADHVRP